MINDYDKAVLDRFDRQFLCIPHESALKDFIIQELENQRQEHKTGTTLTQTIKELTACMDLYNIRRMECTLCLDELGNVVSQSPNTISFTLSL